MAGAGVVKPVAWVLAAVVVPGLPDAAGGADSAVTTRALAEVRTDGSGAAEARADAEGAAEAAADAVERPGTG